MKTALITGSETFGPYMTSPSKWLALAADGKTIGGYRIHSLVLPSVVRTPDDVENSGTHIVNLAQSIHADVIISFGMASEAKGFRIEDTATNWIYSAKYCTAEENNQPIDPTRPAKEQVHIDLSPWNLPKLWNACQQANIPFDSKISDDAGQYSCNGWIYRTLSALKQAKLTTPYLFGHFPCTKESIELIPDFDTDKTIFKKEDTLKVLENLLLSLTP